jgi:hypothetical protein
LKERLPESGRSFVLELTETAADRSFVAVAGDDFAAEARNCLCLELAAPILLRAGPALRGQPIVASRRLGGHCQKLQVHYVGVGPGEGSNLKLGKSGLQK